MRTVFLILPESIIDVSPSKCGLLCHTFTSVQFGCPDCFAGGMPLRLAFIVPTTCISLCVHIRTASNDVYQLSLNKLGFLFQYFSLFKSAGTGNAVADMTGGRLLLHPALSRYPLFEQSAAYMLKCHFQASWDCNSVRGADLSTRSIVLCQYQDLGMGSS